MEKKTKLPPHQIHRKKPLTVQIYNDGRDNEGNYKVVSQKFNSVEGTDYKYVTPSILRVRLVEKGRDPQTLGHPMIEISMKGDGSFTLSSGEKLQINPINSRCINIKCIDEDEYSNQEQ